MVSFLDRLLQTITAKIKKRVTLGKALTEASQGPHSAKSYTETHIAGALSTLEKYEEGFFIKEHMDAKDSVTKV